MNREIKFRGKRIKDGAWAYGLLLVWSDGETHILERGEVTDIVWKREVDPATVGQFTGLTDDCGADIYEGDILAAEDLDRCMTVVAEFRRGAFYFVDRGGGIAYFLDEFGHTAIIGNIHDNPELLKGGNQ